MLHAWCIKLDQLVSGGSMGWVRKAKIWAGVWDRQSGPTNMYALVNPGDVTCVPALVTSSLCQPQRSRGYTCLCSCVM